MCHGTRRIRMMLFLGGTTFFGRFRQDEIEQKALFGEATFDFAERWQIKGGLRWFDVELTSIQGTTHGFGDGAQTPPGKSSAKRRRAT